MPFFCCLQTRVQQLYYCCTAPKLAFLSMFFGYLCAKIMFMNCVLFILFKCMSYKSIVIWLAKNKELTLYMAL